MRRRLLTQEESINFARKGPSGVHLEDFTGGDHEGEGPGVPHQRTKMKLARKCCGPPLAPSNDALNPHLASELLF